LDWQGEIDGSFGWLCRVGVNAQRDIHEWLSDGPTARRKTRAQII
jgi:hypothetical protein